MDQIEEKTTRSKLHGWHIGAPNSISQRYTSIIVANKWSQFWWRISATLIVEREAVINSRSLTDFIYLQEIYSWLSVTWIIGNLNMLLNKFVGPLNLLTLFRQKNIYNSNTWKLEHHGRSNKFVSPLDEFLSMTQTFSHLSELFQYSSNFLTRIRTFQRFRIMHSIFENISKAPWIQTNHF